MGQGWCSPATNPVVNDFQRDMVIFFVSKEKKVPNYRRSPSAIPTAALCLWLYNPWQPIMSTSDVVRKDWFKGSAPGVLICQLWTQFLLPKPDFHAKDLKFIIPWIQWMKAGLRVSTSGNLWNLKRDMSALCIDAFSCKTHKCQHPC